MRDQEHSNPNRIRGRQTAVDGILLSHFGRRPSAALEGALRSLRATEGEPVAGGTISWFTWRKISLATAATVVILLTGLIVRYAVEQARNRQLTTELAWIEQIAETNLVVKGEPTNAPVEQRVLLGGGGGPGLGTPMIGGPIRFGALPGGLSAGGTKGGRGGGDDTAIGGGGIVEGGQTGRMRGGPGGVHGHDNGKPAPEFGFRFQMPDRIHRDYRLRTSAPDTPKRVVLLYMNGESVLRVFLSPSDGPDTPFAAVHLKSRTVVAGRKSGLLIAWENGPTEHDDYERFAAQFLSPIVEEKDGNEGKAKEGE